MGNAFEIKLQQGKIGEDLISRWLIGRGWNILPVYEQSINTGKGPRVFSAETNLVAPDALAFKAGKFMWVEAKTKSLFSFHRITGRYVTGIDLRHYNHYLHVVGISNTPLYLFFLHTGLGESDDELEKDAGLFFGDIQILKDCENHRSDKWGKSGMVYWAKESLTKAASIEQVNKRTP